MVESPRGVRKDQETVLGVFRGLAGLRLVPYENQSLTALQRYLLTGYFAVLDPHQLFEKLPSNDLFKPVTFGVITATILAILGPSGNFLDEYYFSDHRNFVRNDLMEMIFFGSRTINKFILWPLLTVAALFLFAVGFHFLLVVGKTGGRGFGITLRAVVYGSVLNLLALVPVIGAPIGAVWSSILIILGAYYGHKANPWRVIFAFLLALIFSPLMHFGNLMVSSELLRF